MFNILKRTTAIVMVFLMFISSVPVTSMATDEVVADPNYIMFQASQYSDNFHRIFGDDSSSYANTYFSMMREDDALMTSINAWELMHIVTEPSHSLESGLISKKDMYKLVIFDLLGVNNSVDSISNEQSSYVFDLASQISGHGDIDLREVKSLKVTEDYLDLFHNGANVGQMLDAVSIGSKILDAAANMYDAINAYASYQTISNMKNGTKNILEAVTKLPSGSLGEHFDDKDLKDLQAAANECLSYFDGAYNNVLERILNGTEPYSAELIDTAGGLALDLAWDAIISSIPGGAALSVAVKGVRALSDAVFNLDESNESYYKLEANVAFENAIRKIMIDANTDPDVNKNLYKSAYYMQTVNMYKNIVLLGFDYSVDLLKVQASSFSTQCFDWLTKNYSECIALINQINGFKADKQASYARFEDLVSNTYKKLYCPDYESVISAFNNQEIVRVESISLSQIKDIHVGDTGYIGNYIDVIKTPDNANELFVENFSSENEDIIKLNDIDFIEVVSTGKCTIVCNKGDTTEARITVTVKETDEEPPHDFLSDFEYSVNSDGVTAKITGYNGSETNLIIPDAIDGYSVTDIGASAFRNHKNIKSVLIPASVKRIDDYAFGNCTGLTSVVIPNTVESVGHNPFSGCTFINTVTISDKTQLKYRNFLEDSPVKTLIIADGTESISSKMVVNTQTIEKIVIPETVTYIDIPYCNNLKEFAVSYRNKQYSSYDGVLYSKDKSKLIRFPANKCSEYEIKDFVEEIDASAFYGCSELKSVTIPDSVSIMGAYAFENCTNLESIKMPCDLRTVYYTDFMDTWFDNCDRLETLILTKGSSESVYALSYAFADTNIKKVIFEEGITKVENYAFQDCASIEEVEFCSTIENIQYCAFENCSKLVSVILPKNLRFLGSWSFRNCSSLSDVSILSDDMENVGEDVFLGTSYYNNPENWDGEVLYLGNCLIKANEVLEGSYSVKAETIVLADKAFKSCSNLNEIVLPESVKFIGKSTFESCYNLKKIDLSKELVSFGKYAFKDCNSLKTVYFNGEVEDWLKYDCFTEAVYLTTGELLRYEYIENNPCGKGADLYINGAKLTELETPDSISVINECAFYNCDSLEKVVFSESVTHIGEAAFKYCSNLKTVQLSKNTERIEASAFYYGGLDGYLVIPESCSFIGNNTFNYSYIDGICILNSTCEIESNAFYYNTTVYGYENSTAEEFCINSGSSFSPDFEALDCENGYLFGISFHSGANGSDESVMVVAPNCTEWGYTVYKCRFCGEPYNSDLVDPTGHKKEFISTVNPDCESSGYTEYYCTVCGDNFISDYTEALGHQNVVVNIINPGCYTDGYTEYRCAICNTESLSDYVDALGEHNFENGICLTCGFNESLKYHISTWGDGKHKGEKFACVEGFSGDVTDLVIPDYIEGYPVQMIESFAFQNNTEIRTVSFPGTLTYISSGAFYGCTGLEEVHITDLAAWCSVKCADSYTNPLRYADGLYLNGELLTDLVIPEGVEEIGTEIFALYKKINSIFVPSSVKHINSNAFYGCDSIKHVLYSGSEDEWNAMTVRSGNNYLLNAVRHYSATGNEIVYDVGKVSNCTETGYTSGVYCSLCEQWLSGHKFIGKNHTDNDGDEICDICQNPVVSVLDEGACGANGDNLTWTLYDDGTLVIVGLGEMCDYSDYELVSWSPFKNDERIEQIIIDTGVTSIGAGAFSDCTELKSVSISDTVLSIGDGAFMRCIGLNEILIPNSVKSIGDNAFSYCESLTEFIIPGSVKNIYGRAFGNCTSLKSVTIENGVEKLYDFVFADCTNLENISISDSVTSIGYRVFDNTKYYNDYSNWLYGILYIDKHLISANSSISGAYEIKPGTLTIAYSAFGWCTYIESIVIPDSVTHIESWAFQRCRSLKSVNLPNSVKSIGNAAFHECESLTDIKIPEGITNIYDRTFYGCTDLVSIEIPATVVEISWEAFYNCENLENVYYQGKAAQWNEIVVSYNNTDLTGANILFPNDTKTQIDSLSDVHAHYTGDVFDEKAEFKVEKLVAADNTLFNGSYTRYISYNISFLLNDEQIQPKGNVTIKMPVPNGFDSDKTAVYYVESDGDAVRLESKYENGYVYFVTDHFSKYVLVDEGSLHYHSYNSKIITEATCTEGGYTIYICSCNDSYIADKVFAIGHKYDNACDTTCNRSGCGAKRSISHSYKSVTTKATLSKNGKVENKCAVCGYVSKTTMVYYPKTIKLSTTSYTYNGKTKKPSVTVKDSKGNTLKKDTDYTVKYESGRKAPGKYTIKIIFKGKYSGEKMLYFTIAPKATSKITASQTTTTITLKWSKVTGADGYRVYKYNTKTKKYEKLKDVTGNSLKISKLSVGTKYKYKVRAYTKDGGTIWGAYSSTFETATKCKTPSITKLTTTKGKASFTWSNVSGESGYQVYYSTKKDSGYKKLASYKANVVKGLKSKLTSGKTYYFKVRAYTKTESGTVYSAWSSVKSVKVK